MTAPLTPAGTDEALREARAAVRDCIPVNLLLCTAWISAIMRRVVEPLFAELATLRSDRDRLTRDLAAAREALKPFAEAAEDLEDGAPDAGHLWESPAAMGLCAGDLRRARTALTPGGDHADTK